ncbi:hypothetical protein CEB3_c31150 [Peptococcaceae bacterium CEB3]|nr:hypothetical protein CEB3_c31150 [Peptococcaceae bacterium CEB3]
MATSSVYKQVRVKGRGFCRNFVKALESAERISGKDVTCSKRVQEVKGDNIRKMFRIEEK